MVPPCPVYVFVFRLPEVCIPIRSDLIAAIEASLL